ncbi:MAG: hypothetical protein IIA45_03335, partial [Bacteroidetes bacterium]|nr:hypothetical protein [Bacteroidota bacterium]
NMSTKEIVALIKSVGKRPIERDSVYNVIEDYSDHIFTDDEVDVSAN